MASMDAAQSMSDALSERFDFLFAAWEERAPTPVEPRRERSAGDRPSEAVAAPSRP